MIKEPIIPKKSEISFFIELNNTTNSSSNNKILKQSIIPSNKNNNFLKKENKSISKLLCKKLKFKIINEKTNKFIIKKSNNKRSLQNNIDLNKGQWNKDEKIKFIEGIYRFGSNWRIIKKYIGTRLAIQVRSHPQKFFLKCKKFKDDSLDIDFTKDNIDKKYIIKTLRDIIDNSRDENIIEILYKKLEKVNLEKDAFKKGIIKINVKETNISNETNFNNEKIMKNFVKGDNYNDLKKDSCNIFESEEEEDYEDFEKFNLFDFNERINRMEYSEIFNYDVNNDYSFSSKDNDFILDELFVMDINNEENFC